MIFCTISLCQGQKGSGAYIPHHASPAVAASAAAAREAAAAGNGEIMPATSLFVRKVLMDLMGMERDLDVWDAAVRYLPSNRSSCAYSSVAIHTKQDA